MKTLVVLLLCVTVSLRAAAAAPAEEVKVEQVEVQEEPKTVPLVEVKEELPPNTDAVVDLAPLPPEVHTQLCLPGWEFFRGSCYYLNNNYNTWGNSVSFCANFEATLASVTSPLEYNHLQHMVGSAGHTSAWIGGYYFENEWRWHDGTYFSYSNWDNRFSTASYKCVVMNSQPYKGWFNSGCHERLPSVCKVKVNC